MGTRGGWWLVGPQSSSSSCIYSHHPPCRTPLMPFVTSLWWVWVCSHPHPPHCSSSFPSAPHPGVWPISHGAGGVVTHPRPGPIPRAVIIPIPPWAPCVAQSAGAGGGGWGPPALRQIGMGQASPSPPAPLVAPSSTNLPWVVGGHCRCHWSSVHPHPHPASLYHLLIHHPSPPPCPCWPIIAPLV